MELVKALVRQAQPGALGLLVECSVESVPLEHAVQTLNALQGEKAVILFGEA